MLSVVFIGNASLSDAHKRGIFQLRKDKVWRFLLWLKQNNVLYENVKIDRSLMDLYPAEGLPGLEDRIINVDMPADEIFEGRNGGSQRAPCLCEKFPRPTTPSARRTSKKVV